MSTPQYTWALRTERLPDDHWDPPPRTEWGDGPWQTEADLVEWRGKDTPYPLIIVRGGMGQLNGYVGVPDTHPLYGKSSVLGCNWTGPSGGLRVATGEPPTHWWLGFDCGHSGQYCPVMESRFNWLARLTGTAPLKPETVPENYVTIEVCRVKVEALATVFHVAAGNPPVLEALL